MVVLGEDVGKVGGVFRVTAGLQDEFGEERVIDTPLSENGIVGAAVGMALYGLVPVVEIQFADFIWPAYDQIVNELAKYRYRSGGEYSAKIVIRTPVGGGIRGGHYHSQHPESAFISVPGLKVVCPSNPYDAKGLLLSAIRDPDPVLFFEPKRVYRAAKGEVPDGDYTVPLESASVVRKGATSPCSPTARCSTRRSTRPRRPPRRASRPRSSTCARSGRSTSQRSSRACGRPAVSSSCTRRRRRCGFGAELVSLVVERAFYHLEAPPVRVTGFDTPFPYTLEMEYLPLSHRILPAILERRAAGAESAR